MDMVMDAVTEARAAVVEEIAARVRTLRQERGWSQEKLARRAECSRQTIRRLESSEVMPDLETVGAVAAAFELDWKDLLPSPRMVYEASIRYFAQTLFEQGERAPQRDPKRLKLTASARRSA